MDAQTIDTMQYTSSLAELKCMPGYPYDEAKDSAFIAELLAQFPSLNFVEQIRQWKAWMLDNDEQILSACKKRGKINHRARLRRWCANASRWEKPDCVARYKTGKMKEKNAKYEFEKSSPPKGGEAKIQEVW